VAVINGNGMKYVTDVNTTSTYEVYLDGRVIMEVGVDNTDPDLKIFIGKPGTYLQHSLTGDASGWVVTQGTATKGVHEVGGSPSSPGTLKDHVDGMTLQMFVLPNALRLLADLYIPRI
jgi:hypothetical protein